MRGFLRLFGATAKGLVAALRHPDFLAGRTTTSFIEDTEVALARRPSPAELRTAATAAALAAQAARRAAAPVLATLPSGWRNTVMPPERAEFRHGPDTVVVSYARRRDDRFDVTVTGAGPDPDGASGSGEPVTVHHAGGGWIDFSRGGHRHRLHVLTAGDRVWAQGPDGDLALTAVPRFPDAEPGEQVAGGLVAPMPGTVLAVHAAARDTVAAGQLIMIVEAMKMEHRITAPQAGTVTEIRARPGNQVSAGDLLAVISEAQ